mgnify:FL=1
MTMGNNILAQGERFFQEERTALFRKEEFAYMHTGIIDEDGEMWTTTELDEANLSQVYNQYRVRHGIPFPDDIAALRKHYGLSAAKMSQILGFGINQYRMYEEGEVPSISNARTIIAAHEKSIFLSFLEATKADLTETEYIRIHKKVENAVGDCIITTSPSAYSGYRSLSKKKIAAVCHMIISRMGSVFVTKMNKLLFYIDFIHYKRHGFGITGLSYKALQYGPVPERWGSVYAAIPGIEMAEFVYPSGQSGIRLEIHNPIDHFSLDEKETDTVKSVCQLFGDISAGEISEISHREHGWISNHTDRSAISYQEAFALHYT